MNNNRKGIFIIIFLAVLCVGMIGFFSSIKKVPVDNEVTADNADSAPETTEDHYAETIRSYPYYGMRESDLNHCLLGKPMIVSECSNFDKLPVKHKVKYYYFGYSGYGNNSGKIIVRYRRNRTYGGGYDDLPSDNGYVDSGYYIDGEGVEYQLDENGLTRVDEETDTSAETPTEEVKKNSGGRLLPGSKNSGAGNSYGGTSSKKSTSATTEFDPDDHDIEGYYEDNKDDFESIDDAYDAFEDDEDAWDDY